ncbi:MAG: methyltransferase, partial [Kiritimatiellae bacterium]|nr:methyltransferase [Kiritimatiellia bacterium]
MRNFLITDPGGITKTETFLDGACRVVSRSGLHPAEAVLLENIPRMPSGVVKVLVAGNRTGAVAMALAERFPAVSLVCHIFDIHHARAVGRNLAANGFEFGFVADPFVTAPIDLVNVTTQKESRFLLACTSDIPPSGYDAALFMASAKSVPNELILDQLHDIQRNLIENGFCLIACEGDSGFMFKHIKALFGNITVLSDKKGVFCVTVRKRKPIKRVRDFSAEFEVSLPGGSPVKMVSLPGVFCHRRPDAGGLALAEIGALEMRPGLRVLDIGCGCGLVGCLLASSQPDARVTFLDSHARALAATRRNIAALGLQKAEMFLSDTGLSRSGYHLALGNAPYFSDFRIARLFAETARSALLPHGVCMM